MHKVGAGKEAPSAVRCIESAIVYEQARVLHAVHTYVGQAHGISQLKNYSYCCRRTHGQLAHCTG